MSHEELIVTDIPWFYQGSSSETVPIDHAKFYMCLHRKESASDLRSTLFKYVLEKKTSLYFLS